VNTRVRFEEGVLWKLLALSFAAHVAVLAAWPEARVSAVTPRLRAELAFVDVPPPRVEPAPPVPSPPAPVKRTAGPRRSVAQRSTPMPPSTVETPASSALDLTSAPSPVVLPVFTLPSQSTGPARVGPPTGPSSTGSDRPGGALREGDAEPALLSEVRVPYPASARERGIEGAVKLRVTVDAGGVVQGVVVLSGPGFGLDDAARDALMKFRFKPSTRGGQPVAATFIYTYRFELD
jgi:protein TonB